MPKKISIQAGAVKATAEPDARTDVEVGDLGYWVDGKGFCIFSDVNVFGKVEGDATIFKSVPGGEPVKIEKA